MGEERPKCEYSELECSILYNMINRRKLYRDLFLKLKSDPCKHSLEKGYVFDENLQRFISMKTCQLDHFQANFRTIRFAILVVVIPFFTYGYFVWNERNNREQKIRCGQVRYMDRDFKFQ